MEGISWQTPEKVGSSGCMLPEGAVCARFGSGIRVEYVGRTVHRSLGVLVGRASVCANGDVLLIAAAPSASGWGFSGRTISSRCPGDDILQILVNCLPSELILDWVPCPADMLPSNAVPCGWHRAACHPLYAGKSSQRQRYQHIGAVQECSDGAVLHLSVGTCAMLQRRDCEVLCWTRLGA
jgi:hypothetical protein